MIGAQGDAGASDPARPRRLSAANRGVSLPLLVLIPSNTHINDTYLGRS